MTRKNRYKSKKTSYYDSCNNDYDTLLVKKDRVYHVNDKFLEFGEEDN